MIQAQTPMLADHLAYRLAISAFCAKLWAAARVEAARGILGEHSSNALASSDDSPSESVPASRHRKTMTTLESFS